MQIQTRIIANERLWANIQTITVTAPDLARTIRPGQFVLARAPNNFDPYLRRVLIPLQTRDDQIQFAMDAADPLVARAYPDAILDLLAPLGRAIHFDSNARHILLATDGARIAPLIFLAHAAIQSGRAVVLVARQTNASPIFPAALLPEEIEYHTTNENEAWMDADALAWADAIYACGTRAAYRELFDAISHARYRVPREFARVWMEAAMPCGVGECFACAIESARGFALTCQHGPFFDLVDI
ncbi:MAG: hypothetical protein HY257_06790 [Chloroflexi bacterium]|nr:hypothetical protein [Chloroflexota bacterium]